MLFELKTLHVGTSTYSDANHRCEAVARRDRALPGEYAAKARRIDQQFCDTPSGVTGPVEAELRTFDQNGNVAMYVYEKDEGADSIITSRKTWTYTYDEQDREIELRREIDQDADGTIDELYLITTVYDDASNSYTQTTRADNENDGVWDSEFSEQRTYDEDGNLIRLHAGNIEKTYTWVQLCY